MVCKIVCEIYSPKGGNDRNNKDGNDQNNKLDPVQNFHSCESYFTNGNATKRPQ